MGRGKRNVFIVVIVALALVAQYMLSQQQPRSDDSLSGKVVRIVDGDSLYLEGYKQQIRLWAVDAPERDEPGYAAAREQLRQLAADRQLTCYIQDTDKYGRTVARCEDRTGRDVNRAMLQSGTAAEYCRFSNNFYGNC